MLGVVSGRTAFLSKWHFVFWNGVFSVFFPSCVLSVHVTKPYQIIVHQRYQSSFFHPHIHGSKAMRILTNTRTLLEIQQISANLQVLLVNFSPLPLMAVKIQLNACSACKIKWRASEKTFLMKTLPYLTRVVRTHSFWTKMIVNSLKIEST